MNSKHKGLPKGWKKVDNKIRRKFEFTDFPEAINFVKKTAEIAEDQNHHPNILIEYNQVTITVWTHEENAITDKDIKLALSVNSVFEVMN
jgi:4a-hydroxytetrahydrobiopterin dehydratase